MSSSARARATCSAGTASRGYFSVILCNKMTFVCHVCGKISLDVLNPDTRHILQIIEIVVGQMMFMARVGKDGLNIYTLLFDSEQQHGGVAFSARYTDDVGCVHDGTFGFMTKNGALLPKRVAFLMRTITSINIAD
ncbi:hypothetical protein [Serratia fonticola]|uniref:hypothetical protein n=1 Tax=Serratia fonticola TaxID=47917 RepID=UPI0020C5C7F7|nr:hypothetical protein [Serratia fonticola]